MSESEKLCKFIKEILHVSVCIILLMFAAEYFWSTIDPTDKDRNNRSGLRLHIDHETGIHYLSTPEGYLIRREGDYR